MAFLVTLAWGENGFFGNFASGVNISFQITPDDATLSIKQGKKDNSFQFISISPPPRS